MTKEKAVQKILTDLHLPSSSEDYVRFTIGVLGCDDTIDLDTVKAIKEVIQKDIH